ncbi:MAG: sel1 repeat family protein [Gammaproteobacteria bacterium]|nr:sel1 repeat family protein [Gammaproteobacteria bacterium]NVK88989.1 sel1 repeat family protein [Gammaproteobacteria bacterium]
MTVRLIGILCLIVGSFAFASSNSYRQGGTSIYFTQLGHLKHQAELGDPNAQFLLGNLYLSPPSDTSVRQNLPKAAEYYFQAAVRDHAGAQYNLGVMYFRGTGVAESKMMASVWFTLAANNQSPVAKNVKKNAQTSLIDLNATLSSDEKQQAKQWLDTISKWIREQNYRLARLPELNS